MKSGCRSLVWHAAVGSAIVVGAVGCSPHIDMGSLPEAGGASGVVAEAGTGTGGSTGVVSSSTTSVSQSSQSNPSGSCISKVLDSTGYLTVGKSWAGWAFTGTNSTGATIDTTCTGTSTVSPACLPTGCTPTFSGWMTGTVAACSDSGGYAQIGWNLAQKVIAPHGEVGLWPVPASGGVTVTFTNPDNATVQLTVGTNSTFWCAPVTSGVEVPWSAFVTNCWPGGMPRYPIVPGSGVQNMSLTVTGSDVPVPFDICLEDITITP